MWPGFAQGRSLYLSPVSPPFPLTLDPPAQPVHRESCSDSKRRDSRLSPPSRGHAKRSRSWVCSVFATSLQHKLH